MPCDFIIDDYLKISDVCGVMPKHRLTLSKDERSKTISQYNKKYAIRKKQQKSAIKFFQMVQAASEIAIIDTTKLHENNRKHIGAGI